MFVSIKIDIFLIISLLHTAVAWTPPERCRQGSRISPVHLIVTPTPYNITEIARNQQRMLLDKYESAQFFGIPIRGRIGLTTKRSSFFTMYIPYSCTIYTYEPRHESSIHCEKGIICGITQTVSTTSPYYSFEGYNWGTKLSTKFSFSEKIFEVGGEVSTFDTYSCTHSKFRTATQNVSCSALGEGNMIELYGINSDMKCKFGEVTMVQDRRNGKMGKFAPDHYFTTDELNMVDQNALIKGEGKYLLNLDKMSDSFVIKMKRQFPYFNPYTDLIETYKPLNRLVVFYFKYGPIIANGIEKVIPFTDENGESVNKLVCVLTKK